MNAVLPIIICSAISASLGYYFGHITIPPGALDETSSAMTAPNYTNPATPAISTPAPPQNLGVSAPQQVAPTQSAPVAPAAPVAPVAPTTIDPLTAGTTLSAEAASSASSASASDDTAAFAARAAQPVQTLRDTQGRAIEASIVEVTDQNVKIRRTDGLETMIPLSMLSPEDIAFCNYLREQQKEKEAAAPPPVQSDGFDWDAYFNS